MMLALLPWEITLHFPYALLASKLAAILVTTLKDECSSYDSLLFVSGRDGLPICKHLKNVMEAEGSFILSSLRFYTLRIVMKW